MAHLAHPSRAAADPARSEAWLMRLLRRAGAALTRRRPPRPEELPAHLQRDIGLLDHASFPGHQPWRRDG